MKRKTTLQATAALLAVSALVGVYDNKGQLKSTLSFIPMVNA